MFPREERAWQLPLVDIRLSLTTLLTTKLYSAKILLVAWLVKMDNLFEISPSHLLRQPVL